jgi:competence protein ComEA
MLTDPPQETRPNRWLLRRIDQAVIAGFCAFGLVAVGLYWIAQGGLRGRMIEIDHADKVAVDFKGDVNAAEWAELVTIPEIGQTLAHRIVDYRRQHGPFQAVEDLRHVRGIGPKTLERLKAYLLPLEPQKVVETDDRAR